MPGLYKDGQEWSHPLIMTPKRNFSRRHLIGVSGGAIAGLTLLPNTGDIRPRRHPGNGSHGQR
jgi:hypothetical protein